jgi:hypothetical protein
MTPGRSQLHELRVIALQKHVQPSLGIPFDLKESIDGAWFGLEDVLLVDWSKNPLKSLVTSKSHARHLILSYKPSMRKIRALRASLVASIALARKQKPRGISYQ